MKEIKYRGCLTDDLEEINNTDKDKDSFSLLYKLIIEIWIILIILLLLSGVLGKFNPTVLSSFVSSITAVTLTTTVRRNNKSAKEIRKMQTRDRVVSLIPEISEYKRSFDDKVSFESVYQIDDVLNAVVVQTPCDETKENNVSVSDFSDYVDEITSDIYIVNKSAKIKVLREIKNILTFGDDKKHITGSSTLYELEDEEIPKKSELPVKQVLKLRNDKDEKHSIWWLFNWWFENTR